MNTKKTLSSYHKQSGVIIVIALVTLLVMTMVGLTAIGNATLQEKMAANNRFYFQARLNAETALREAEDYLSGRVDPAIVLNTNDQVFDVFNAPADDHLYMAWEVEKKSNNIQKISLNNELAKKASWGGINTQSVSVNNADNDSQYIIEYIGFSDLRGSSSRKRDLSAPASTLSNQYPPTFRITAIGYSSNDNIYSVLETTFSSAVR